MIVRVDPGVFAAAAGEPHLAETEVSAVVNASLALAAAPDRFKAWLRDSAVTLAYVSNWGAERRAQCYPGGICSSSG
jgi:hypothetical protein